MRRMMLNLLLAVFPVCAADADGEVRRTWIAAPISISESGEAQIGKVEGAHGALATGVANALAKQRYLPARVDGKPVASQANLSATLVLTPRGDLYDITFEDLRLSPRVDRLRPPRFPLRMAERRKSGYAELRIFVGVDGTISRVATVAASDPAFEEAARESLRAAKFDPIRIDGKAIATESSVLALFRFEKQPLPTYRPACQVNDRQPRADGQDGCLPTIEIVGTSVRRVETRY